MWYHGNRMFVSKETFHHVSCHILYWMYRNDLKSDGILHWSFCRIRSLDNAHTSSLLINHLETSLCEINLNSISCIISLPLFILCCNAIMIWWRLTRFIYLFRITFRIRNRLLSVCQFRIHMLIQSINNFLLTEAVIIKATRYRGYNFRRRIMICNQKITIVYKRWSTRPRVYEMG